MEEVDTAAQGTAAVKLPYDPEKMKYPNPTAMAFEYGAITDFTARVASNMMGTPAAAEVIRAMMESRVSADDLRKIANAGDSPVETAGKALARFAYAAAAEFIRLGVERGEIVSVPEFDGNLTGGELSQARRVGAIAAENQVGASIYANERAQAASNAPRVAVARGSAAEALARDAHRR